MLKKETIQYIEGLEQEGYELLKTLAQIPSPSNHEEKRMEFCKNWLESFGASGVYTDSALNVVYPYQVETGKPVIVFMAHTDVVFPDETTLPWKEEGNLLCCPGIGDDTANLVALMLTARYVTEKKLDTKEYGIVFVCNSGEEGLGNLKGSRRICEDYGAQMERFYSFDGSMAGVTDCAVGSERYQVTVKTMGGHSYGSFGNPNAIAKISEIISEIYQIVVPKEGKTTYNVGVIQGGTSVNTIAQEVSMLCEYRSDRAESLSFMRSEFQKIFKKERTGAEVMVEVVGVRPCENISGEKKTIRNQMLKDSVELLKEMTGTEPKLGSGSTDCNIPLSMGIPSVCYGTYNGSGAHTREEYVEKDSLVTGYKVAFASVLQYFEEGLEK